MKTGRVARRTAALLATALALALLSMPPLTEAGGGVRRADRTPRSAHPRVPRHLVVALGDSVPSGAACRCRPFPTLYASMLSARTGATVTVRNFAVNGLTTAGLLTQLQEPSEEKTLARADIVLLTIGANDFEDHHDEVVGDQCNLGTHTDCVTDELESMRAHLAAILARIRELRQGTPTTVLVTNYWNVFEDGDVARRASGTTGVQASIALTRSVNAAIESDSVASGARYVDLFAPFQERGKNITALLAPDGDHPDAAGHRLIAATLVAVGLPRADWH